MSAQAPPPSATGITAEQYLELERAAEFRSEFFAGPMYAMSGGSYRHAVIISAFSFAFRSAVKKRPCRVVNERP
jgi:Uma2 family endonuclease